MKKSKKIKEHWEQVLHQCENPGAMVVVQERKTKRVNIVCIECKTMYMAPTMFPLALPPGFITIKRSMIE